ncbi:MAG: winged helix DNA-binding domain-containing protein [Candidatus Limnocylindrales bacterium]
MRLSVAQVLAFRLRRQFLVEPAAHPLDVVRALAGIQAQVPSAAEAAVAIRVAAAPEPRLVDDLLAGGRAIRTWAMRGTLHVLSADEAPAYLALMAATRSWERPAWQRAFITAVQLASLRSIVAEALADGPKSREQLVAAVEAASGDTGLVEQMRSGWGTVLKPLAWLGELCNAPEGGSRVVFSRPADLLPGWPGLLEPEEAARVVLPRFLAAHGPASEADFLGWLSRGATRSADARRWVAALGGEIVRVEVGDGTALALARDLDELAGSRPTDLVRLLPAFDPYVLGAGTGNPWIIAPARRGAVSRAGGWISPVVLAGGHVAGIWSQDDGALAAELFSEQADTVDREALAAECRRLGATALEVRVV